MHSRSWLIAVRLILVSRQCIPCDGNLTVFLWRVDRIADTCGWVQLNLVVGIF